MPACIVGGNPIDDGFNQGSPFAALQLGGATTATIIVAGDACGPRGAKRRTAEYPVSFCFSDVVAYLFTLYLC